MALLLDRWQAQADFWSGMGLPAYDETAVPDNAALPYLTYSTAVGEFDGSIPVNVSLWYYGRGWGDISRKADELLEVIGMGGEMVRYDKGAMWIKRGSPLAYRVPDDNDMIRRIAFNFTIEFTGA